jgi:hypothetical protein
VRWLGAAGPGGAAPGAGGLPQPMAARAWSAPLRRAPAAPPCPGPSRPQAPGPTPGRAPLVGVLRVVARHAQVVHLARLRGKLPDGRLAGLVGDAAHKDLPGSGVRQTGEGGGITQARCARWTGQGLRLPPPSCCLQGRCRQRSMQRLGGRAAGTAVPHLGAVRRLGHGVGAVCCCRVPAGCPGARSLSDAAGRQAERRRRQAGWQRSGARA